MIKIKPLVYLILVSPVFYYVVSYTQWELRYPKIPIEAISDIVFISDEKGFFVNDAGSIWKTEDNGNSWHQCIHLPRDVIKQIDFINSQIGYALSPHSYIGDQKNLLKTIDGGDTWQTYFYELNDAIKILPLNESICLKSTENGEISKTADAFVSWSQKYIMPYFFNGCLWVPYGEITTLEKLPNNKIIALGNNYLARDAGIISDSITFILSSPDSGETWNMLWSGTPYVFNSINFINDQIGWMGGEWNTIAKTIDGGFTWNIQYQDSINQEGIVSIFTLDSLNLVAISEYGMFFQSIDGGESWNISNLISNYGFLTKVLFTDSLKGFITGSPGNFLKTENSGGTWEPVDNSFNISIKKIDFISSHKGWAVGGKNGVGYLFQTQNGGFDWAPILIDSSVIRFSGIEMLDSLHGWSVGYNKVYRTDDGWSTWSSFELRPNSNIQGIYFHNATFGVIFDVHDYITHQSFNYITTNGGNDWIPYELNSFTSFTKIKFTDYHHGWYVNQEGLWFSSDTGKTWTSNPNLSIRMGFSFDFYDTYDGWVANWFDEIVKTQDGGNTWIIGLLPFGNQISDMKFIDTERGITAGFDGVIFTTIDGGNNWIQESSYTSNWLSNIATVVEGKDLHIWIAGDGFTVLHKILSVSKIFTEIIHKPNEYKLEYNYPNPFNPTTTIEFALPFPENTSLKIYNVLGEEVATLVSERLPAGTYKYSWDAFNITNGVYFYQLRAGDYIKTKKMLLLK